MTAARLALAASAAAVALAAGPSAARAGFVDYTQQGNVQVASLATGGVTASAPSVVNVRLLNLSTRVGLGVVGGNDFTIDFLTGEAVRFTFDAGPTTGVSADLGNQTLNLNMGPLAANVRVEGFGAAGGSLGTADTAVPPSGGSVDVSGLFGGAPLAGFALTPLSTPGTSTDFETRVSVRSLTFGPAGDPSAVPEPASLGLAAAAGLGLLGYARRRRTAA